jgi:hypothetical protein
MRQAITAEQRLRSMARKKERMTMSFNEIAGDPLVSISVVAFAVTLATTFAVEAVIMIRSRRRETR